MMRARFAMLLLSVVFAPSVCAVPGRLVTLTIPHPLRKGESASLELTVGFIERGAEIEITTKSGRLLGVVSPFGIRPGNQAGTYTVPLPADAILDSRLSLRLTLDLYGGIKRAPTANELKTIRIKISRAARQTTDGPK